MTATAVNDAPTATNLNAGESYTEDTGLNLTDIVVTDVDSANVTVTLTLSDLAAGSLKHRDFGRCDFDIRRRSMDGKWCRSRRKHPARRSYF